MLTVHVNINGDVIGVLGGVKNHSQLINCKRAIHLSRIWTRFQVVLSDFNGLCSRDYKSTPCNV